MGALSALPRDINHVRTILFTLPLLFSLSGANNEQFWSLIKNVCLIQTSNDASLRKHDQYPMHMQNHMILHFKRSRASPSVSQGK